MTTSSFEIGCTYTGRFVGDADSVFQVKVLARSAKTVTVEWEAPVTEDKIKAILREINYPAA